MEPLKHISRHSRLVADVLSSRRRIGPSLGGRLSSFQPISNLYSWLNNSTRLRYRTHRENWIFLPQSWLEKRTNERFMRKSSKKLRKLWIFHCFIIRSSFLTTVGVVRKKSNINSKWMIFFSGNCFRRCNWNNSRGWWGNSSSRRSSTPFDGQLLLLSFGLDTPQWDTYGRKIERVSLTFTQNLA